MQDDLKNILSNADDNMSQEQLLKYLKNELAQTERHHLEKQAADNPFETDAIEGLEEIENPQKIALVVDDLNRHLKRKTQKRVNSRERMKLKPLWTLYFSILILLMIITLVYLFLHKPS